MPDANRLSDAGCQPLVSVMMPVYGFRNGLVAASLASYLHQDYPNRQLIVIDDSEEPLREMFETVNAGGEIVYVHCPQRLNIGQKRNLACDLADGEIIIHADSDDLSAPDRISSQVNDLLMSGKPVTGYHTLPLFDLLTNRAYLYHHHKSMCCGASLAYWRAHWVKHPFKQTMCGEDEPYCIAHPASRYCTDGSQSILILLHDDNTSTAAMARSGRREFAEISPARVPPYFFSFHSECFVGYSGEQVN